MHFYLFISNYFVLLIACKTNLSELSDFNNIWLYWFFIKKNKHLWESNPRCPGQKKTWHYRDSNLQCRCHNEKINDKTCKKNWLKNLKKELVEFYWVSHWEWDSSATLSHYRQTRRLLAAPFRAWPIRTLIIQPGQGGLPLLTPVDAILSADVASTLLKPSDLVSLSNSPSTQAPLGSQTCATGPPVSKRIKLIFKTN